MPNFACNVAIAAVASVAAKLNRHRRDLSHARLVFGETRAKVSRERSRLFSTERERERDVHPILFHSKSERRRLRGLFSPNTRRRSVRAGRQSVRERRRALALDRRVVDRRPAPLSLSLSLSLSLCVSLYLCRSPTCLSQHGRESTLSTSLLERTSATCIGGAPALRREEGADFHVGPVLDELADATQVRVVQGEEAASRNRTKI